MNSIKIDKLLPPNLSFEIKSVNFNPKDLIEKLLSTQAESKVQIISEKFEFYKGDMNHLIDLPNLKQSEIKKSNIRGYSKCIEFINDKMTITVLFNELSLQVI